MSDTFLSDRIPKINELETFLYNTNKKFIEDFPIVRIQIAYFLGLVDMEKINHKNISKEIIFKKLPFNFQSFIQLVKLYLKLGVLRVRSNNLLKNKALVFGFSEHYKKQNNGESVNLYLSPVKSELKKLEIEFEELLISNNSTTVEMTKVRALYELLYQYNFLLFTLKAKLFKKYKSYIREAECIYDFLMKNAMPEPAHCANTYFNSKLKHEVSYGTFKQLLKIVKPRLIWTYVYYDNNMLALCRAANLYQIPIVEYQHSQQSDIHFAYSKWNRINSYRDYFPSKFWVWAKSDADRILKNFVTETYKPEIIVGGNIAVIQQQEVFNYKEPNASNGILISLTGGWIPDYLQNIIEKDTKYKWYFRSHPRYPQDSERLQVFKNRFPEKIETDIANRLPLYELFTFVTVNITDASGTVLEAEYFGIKNIITDDAGRFIFKEKIKCGQFLSVSNETEISEILYASVSNEFEVMAAKDSNLLEKLNKEMCKLFLIGKN